jgi:hypothetical protein
LTLRFFLSSSRSLASRSEEKKSRLESASVISSTITKLGSAKLALNKGSKERKDKTRAFALWLRKALKL